MSLVQINLLPQKKSFLETQKRVFVGKIVGFFCFALLILFISYVSLLTQASRFKQQNEFLSQEVLQYRVDGAQFVLLQQHKNKLQQILRSLQKVHDKQERFLLILVKLGNLTPSGVQLEIFKSQQSTLNISGKAMSYALLAQFINKLEHAQVLEKIRLGETKADAEKNITFSLQGEF